MHTLLGNGRDMFGEPSFKREWHNAKNPLDRAKETMEAAFEFFQKLGVDYYCFHDRIGRRSPKLTNPEVLPGHPLYNDWRRPLSIEFPLL
jgi:xylose isomerase